MEPGIRNVEPGTASRSIARLVDAVAGFIGSDELPQASEIRSLTGLDGRRLIIFANHLSYSDANVVEVLLERAGFTALAARLTALAGPKIYTSRERRFSSLCFGTIKVPQSSDVSSEDAVLSPREVAEAARQAFTVARERLAHGDVLLLFGEGTRSRTGAMQRMLPAAARYFEGGEIWILPAGLTGPDTLFAVGETRPRPARLNLTFGPPIAADQLMREASRDRRVAMDAMGFAVAALLPLEARGVYAERGTMPEASGVLDRVRAHA